MEICIFQTGEPLHIDKGNYRPMRCMLLSEQLIKNGHKVSIISSDFFHQRKIHRTNSFNIVEVSKNLKIYLIPSPGYKKHISLARVFDHLILALRLFYFLKNNRKFKPKRVFIGYPPIFTSLVMAMWCINRKIPFMLDVKDKWPELFLEPFNENLKFLAKKLLFPYYCSAKFVFKKANKITSITDHYIEWIKSFSKYKRNDNDYFVSHLTREPFNLTKDQLKKSINFWKEKSIDILERNYFCFIGSFTKSFDFNFIYKISAKLAKIDPSTLFIICGSGDQYENILKKFSNSSNVLVFGEIDKFNSKVLILNAIATLAPYKNNSNFKGHIPNKIIESLENSTPFITNIDGNLKKIIDEYNNGIFTNNSFDINTSQIEKLISDKEYLKKLKINSRKSYEKLFNFQNTFDLIIENIISM